LNAVRAHTSDMSHAARNLRWLLANFVEEVHGVHSVAVVSADGLLLLTSEPEEQPDEQPHEQSESRTEAAVAPPAIPAQAPPHPAEARMDLAAVVSGLASLTVGAARLMDGGRVRQTTVAMDDGMLFVMSISDGSLLGVHAAADSDTGLVAYHMAMFVSRAGHVLTPALRGELRQVMESAR
jgi:predicted regulator of Ras-like GTPase activity (Roadblock/LC7/MglB family)